MASFDWTFYARGRASWHFGPPVLRIRRVTTLPNHTTCSTPTLSVL